MKKILFSAYSLNIGGIETALVTLLNYLADLKVKDKFEYDITLVLEKKQGIFLDEINSRINIIEYTPNNNKIILIRKGINFFKQLIFSIKNKNKFDFACSYATYSNSGSFIARKASINSTLWCHMDYLEQFNKNKNEVKKFFNEKHYNEFKNIVFVSEKSKETFLEVFPNIESNVIHINNIIDYKSIIDKSNEKSVKDEFVLSSEKIFINISRHDEKQKRISRIIEASKNIVKKNIKFKVLLVGDGEDTEKYQKMVKDYDLQDYIIFTGRKKNPYPYLKLADYVLLTSDYEGSPVIFTEAMILNKPIITTNVAGAEQIQNKFGSIIEKDPVNISNKMMEYINNGYEIKEKFDPEEYNMEALNKLQEII